MLKEIKSGLSKNFQCVMCLYKIIYIHNCPGENNKENTKFPLSDLYPHLNVYYISQMAMKENQPVILDLIQRFTRITFK